MYVADYNKSRIYQMNSSADVTATYDLEWEIGSLAIDANSPTTFEDPSILYGLSRKNDSGLMYRRNISGSVPELIREFPGK